MNLEQKFDWKIQKLEQAYAQEHRNPELALRLAEAYFQKGYYLGKGDDWFELAIERVSEAIDRGMVTSEACTLLANALYGRHEYDSAGQAYRRAIELDPRNALAHVGLGNLEKRRGDFSKARECFKRAATLCPTLWQAHYNLGGAYYQEARVRGFQDCQPLLEKAIYHLIRALQLDPFENFVGNIHKDLGELFLHTRQYQHARRFFTRLLNHDRYRTFAHYYLGLANYHLGKYKLAIQNFRNFLKADPTSAVAYARIGLAYLDLREFKRARLACNRALELDQHNVLALFTIGCSYFDERNYPETRRLFERVLEVDPNYFPAYVELVKASYFSRQYDWIVAQLHEELAAFESTEGYDGGRHYHQGPRGMHRKRLEVLFIQLRDMGQRSFPVLLELLASAQTDSMRFQVWDELYALARRARTEQVVGQLRDPAGTVSQDLGRTILQLAQHLPEALLIQTFHDDEARIRRTALERARQRGEGDMEAVLRWARTEGLEFQGFILRALAAKHSPEADAFLESVLDRPELALRLTAAMALAPSGHSHALEILEQDLEGLKPGTERERALALVTQGRKRSLEPARVIALGTAGSRARQREAPVARREEPRPPPSSCAICHKGQREVERMLAGSRIMICTGCVRELWQDREFIRATDQHDAHCSFCRKSIFEVDSFYARANLLMCDRCLELSMGVIEQEDVSRYLATLP